LDQERRRFGFKLDAGAEFVVLPAVFDLDGINAVMPELASAGKPVLAGLHVLADSREAEFLANEVPGARVPESLVARLRTAEAEGRGTEEGLRIALQVAEGLRGRVAGLVVSGAGNLMEAVAAIRAKLL
ncbi:MAG: methylenetetrahydrofolate reductase, partial [Acidobacteria bacterium]|nr:methylenetetrahydrofolate reductase [Acidobacteriota bacterium]